MEQARLFVLPTNIAGDAQARALPLRSGGHHASFQGNAE
jgi:hypothetical protein